MTIRGIRSHAADAVSFRAAATRRSGLNGFTSQPFAPSALARWISSGWPSVVSIITGIPARTLLEKLEAVHARHVDVADDQRDIRVQSRASPGRRRRRMRRPR